MKRVHIIPNTFDQNTWSVEEVDDVLAYLKQQFTVLPENTRIYHNSITPENDVTPIDERGVRNLQTLDGDIYVVIEPGYDPFTIAYLVIAAITLAFSVYTYMTMPKPQVSAAQSSNNDLADRQNQIRLNGRIPDIFGTLRATPDLIALPYTYYDENDIEIEENLMVIGRGYFEIKDFRDDLTLVQDIQGASVSVYDPGESIVGNTIFKIGDDFTEPPTYAYKSKSINGQTLEMPNDQKIDSGLIYFEAPNFIKVADSTIDFTTMFGKNDSIGVYGAEYFIDDVNLSGVVTFKSDRTLLISSSVNIQNLDTFKNVLLTGALIPVVTEVLPNPPETVSTYITNYRDLSGQYQVSEIVKTAIENGFTYLIKLQNSTQTNPNWSYINEDYTVNSGVVLNKNTGGLNLNGTYIVDVVDANKITLNSPNLVNAEWDKLALQPNQSTQSQLHSVRLDKISEQWVGWFNIGIEGTEQLVFNIFFQNGLFYQDSKGGVWEDSMVVKIEYQYLDADNVPFGAIFTESVRITANNKSSFGRTKKIDLGTSGKVRFRITRTTPTKNDKTQDLCKIKDVYAVQKSDKLHYPGLTVVRSKTIGTSGALSLKERKLNCLVTRKLKVDGTGVLTPTNSAEQALIDLALDEYIGRRSMNELDVVQMKAEIAKIIAYFKSDKAAEFSCTIDDPNLSFEEIAGMVASTVFCEPNRFGSKIQLQFEQPQENAVLLFNHRNKVPKSEKRTESWGVKNKYDGVEIEYTSPVDDTRIKYVASDKANPTNLMSIKSTGIRNEAQAKTRAWREWNKIYHQHTSVQFDALDESEILLRNDKLIVADNTMIETQDGEVREVDGLILVLSQDVVFEANLSYKIYLQLENGSVDMIDCFAMEWTNEITLARPPLVPLVTEDGKYIKTTYQIVKAQEAELSAFMLTEMSPQGTMTNSLTCVNYTDKYYEKDHSFF